MKNIILMLMVATAQLSFNEWSCLPEDMKLEKLKEIAKEFFVKYPSCEEMKIGAETDGENIYFHMKCVKTRV